MKKSEKIVFFGSGPVAAKALELLDDNFEVEAVITKPKPDHHRGSFPVIELAEKRNLAIIFAKNKAELSLAVKQSGLKSRLAILVDFGIIVTQDVIDYFSLGIVNSHFSLLPEWRGADPITFSILSGQSKTGVSLMLINEAMDEGQLLSQKSLEIGRDETTPQLTGRLISLSNELLNETLPKYIEGKLKPYPQDDSIKPTYSKKLTKNDGAIDWNKPAEQIEREIRAYFEWPKSRTSLGKLKLIIRQAQVVDESGTPGKYQFSKSELVVYCSQKALSLTNVQPEGRPAMPVSAFLAGYSSQLAN